MAALGALAACATGPVSGSNDELAEDWVRLATPDGTMDGFFVRPVRGRHPAILTWPDIMGVRQAFQVMARRLAGQGYAVLVINHYYRAAPAPQFDRGYADFLVQGGFEKIRPWREVLTADAIARDATAAIAWLDRRREVDTARGVGTHGYCLGGPHTVWTAAAVPGRVRAAASLHGWRLVTDDPQSPHEMIGQTQASYLFAIGHNDDAEAPEEKTVLRDAAAAAGRPAEVEVYPATHGWTLIDSRAYDAAQAERAWARMSTLFAAL
ncbi:MAG: dienelactone hydrolase family protein [Pseudomonadota bacterium]|nr:dienelactone hydrolase family protein [Pseudomonadota bacterium]